MSPFALIATATLALGTQAPAQSDPVQSAPGAFLRSLDRLSGEFRDLDLDLGENVTLGTLDIRLTDCRYPQDNPSGDAYAYLIINDRTTGAPLFQGWMVASSPALNALDHMRYDVWVLRCRTS
jgi:hypothetical protein